MSPGHVDIFTVPQLSSCQLESSCYYLVLRQPRPVGDTSTKCSRNFS